MARKSSSLKRTFTQLKKLNFLIGKWHTRGEILQDTAGSSKQIRGIDTYEWVSGGHFIFHRVDVFMGNKRTEAIEVIGYDEMRKTYFMTSFDDQGSSTTMYAVLQKRGVLQFGDKKMRSVLTTNKDGSSMNAKWELFENGKTWKPWMTIQLDK